MLKHLGTQQAVKKKAENKDKLIEGLRSREEERLSREAEILKELGTLKKSYLGLAGYSGGSIEKHVKKMVRKCLMLTVDPLPQKTSGALSGNLPSHLHVASIMNERTDEERQTFGKVRLSELKRVRSDGYFTEEVIDSLIEVYTTELKAPYDLIVKTIERSRDRFQREFSRLESHFEQAKFFTEEGVKERKEKLKLKVLLS